MPPGSKSSCDPMDPKRQKLEQQAAEEQVQSSLAQTTPVREFATVEDLLRADAAQHPPPPELAERVAESIRKAPAPARSWWSRWLSGRGGA